MRALPVVLAIALLGPVAAAPLPARTAEGGDPQPPVPGGGPGPAPAPGPAPDNRFFPKEMEDAVAALRKPDPEDAFQEGLSVLARLRFRDGALQPLRDGAFAPILEHALGARLEHIAGYAGEILAALDPARLAAELGALAEGDLPPERVLAAAAMLESVGAVRDGEPHAGAAVDTLVRLLRKGNPRTRARTAEALGEAVAVDRRVPDEAREKAVGAILGLVGGAGKDSDLRNACAIALGKSGSPRGIPTLLNGLGNTDGKHAGFAAVALSWIEDPSILPALLQGPVPGGEAGEAWVKAIEACARPAHVETLFGTLENSGKADVREAAAVALGRLLPDFPEPTADGAPAGATLEDHARSALRLRGSRLLFDRMVGDGQPRVQWACFHAVSRCGGPWLGEGVIRLLRTPNAGNVARAVHLAGDWKLPAAAPILMAAIFSTKDDLLRRRAGIEFFRIGHRESLEEFKKKLRAAEGGVAIARGCEALGTWRCREGYDLAFDLLRGAREGSAEQFAAELCLEKMTGHFFGPYPGVWDRWLQKNPNFFSPKQARIERERWREEFDKENKGFRQTKETERAVQRGLEFLARHQHPDGRWDPQGFRECCDRSPGCPASLGTRVQEDPVGRTGLCVLTFLGAGYSPQAGKYRVAIRRGLEYLMARQQACGDYLTNDLIGGYNRPVALQAYAEAAALTGDPRLVPFVRRGADFLTQIQNDIGGWRYRVEVQTSDSSVAAWMLFAMKAAEKARVPVREIVYEGCRMLFERYSVRVPKDGPREELVDIDPAYGFEVGSKATYEFRTGYQDQAHAPTHATTALGLMSHVLLGFRRSHPFCIGSANYILARQLPEVPKDGRIERLGIKQEYPTYFLYYGTLAMHQMGGKYFRTWNERLRVLLPETQVETGCARGSWTGEAYDGIFGGIYTTAMAVLSLETYYRYLPVLQD